MLPKAATRHFQFIGSFDRHYGPFPGLRWRPSF